MREPPINIHTRKPLEPDAGRSKEPSHRKRQSLEASRFDAQFVQAAQRVRTDLAQMEPDIVASALGPEARQVARALIVEARQWLDKFERELRRSGGLRAI